MQMQLAESLDSSMKSHNDSDVRLVFSSTTEWEAFFLTSSLTFFGIFGICMNTFVFVMYSCKRSFRTSGNTFVLSLAAIDILRIVLMLPISILMLERTMAGEILCKSLNFCGLSMNLASVLPILLIAIDRNCAVQDPFHYVRNNLKRRAVILVIFVWFISLLMAIPVIFGITKLDYDTCNIKVSSTGSIFDSVVIYEYTITLTAYVIPLSSVACLYYGMCRAAINNTLRNVRNSSSSYRSSEVVVNMKSPRSSPDSENSLRRHFYVCDDGNYQQKNRFMKNHRAAVTGLLAVVSCIVCFSPYFIVRLYEQCIMVTIETRLWVYLPTFISSVIDPCIYFYRNRSTKKYIKKLVLRIFQKEKSSMYYSANARSKFVSISDLYRISTCMAKTAVASESMEKRNFRLFSKTDKVQINLYEKDSVQNKDISQSSVTLKHLIHQYSASSNSSDLCPSITSSDSGERMPYQSLKQKYSEESSSEEKH